MKININNTKASIVLSIIYACLLLTFFLVNFLGIHRIGSWYYIIAIADFIYFAWIAIYAIGLLKITNQQALVTVAFIVCIVFSLADTIAGTAVGVLDVSANDLLTYLSISTKVAPLTFLFLLISTFFIKNEEIKVQLQLLAFCKLLSILAYVYTPLLVVNYFSNAQSTNIVNYTTSVVSLLIPVSGIYLAVAVLNLLNSQDLQTAANPNAIQPAWPND